MIRLHLIHNDFNLVDVTLVEYYGDCHVCWFNH